MSKLERLLRNTYKEIKRKPKKGLSEVKYDVDDDILTVRKIGRGKYEVKEDWYRPETNNYYDADRYTGNTKQVKEAIAGYEGNPKDIYKLKKTSAVPRRASYWRRKKAGYPSSLMIELQRQKGISDSYAEFLMNKKTLNNDERGMLNRWKKKKER